MSFTILTRQLLLLTFVALWPAWAFALKETYEGFLVPNNGDAPVSIVVELEDLETFLFGRVKVSPPLKDNSPIETGRIVAGTCNLATALSANVTLRLFGSCDASAFEGIFTDDGSDSRRDRLHPLVVTNRGGDEPGRRHHCGLRAR